MRVFLDYDNVLVDMCEKWAEWHDTEHNIQFTTKDIKDWWWVERTHGKDKDEWWHNSDIYGDDIIMPYAGAKEFVNTVRNNLGDDNVFILTSTYKGTEEVKSAHIMRHFDFKKENIIHAHDKHLLTENSVLVDDNVLTIRKHCLHNDCLGIVFDKDGEFGWSKVNHVLKDIGQLSKNIRFRNDYRGVLELLLK